MYRPFSTTLAPLCREADGLNSLSDNKLLLMVGLVCHFLCVELEPFIGEDVVLYDIVLYFIMLCYVILYYIILYYIILYYIILYYS